MRKLKVTKIEEDTYLLDEFGGTNCYLVVGSKAALLMDTGTGIGDLKGTVKDITELPLIVAVTHGHVDHIGGAVAFPEVYVHKDDCNWFCRLQMTRFIRKQFVAPHGVFKEQGFTKKDVFKAEYKTKLIPFDESKTFDLGDRVITVKHTPGHTRGSVAFIDEKSGIVFSGDNVCDALWMQLPFATTIEKWIDGAEWLLEISRTHRVYWGHRTPQLTTEYIAQVLSWGRELVAKTKKNSILPKTAQYPAQSDGIIYKTNKVLEKHYR